MTQKENTIHATIAKDVDLNTARKEIQKLIEKGVLKDAGFSHQEV